MFTGLLAKMKQVSDKYFLIGLLIMGFGLGGFTYGVHLDQDAEQLILYSNLKGYLELCHLENTGLYSDLDDAGIIPIGENIDKYNGMAVYYPLSFLFYLNQRSPYIGNFVWQTYIFLLCMGGVAALYFLLRDLFTDRRVAVLGTIIYFFTPRMLAESHYNNKDMILLTFTIIVLYFGRRLYRELSWKWVILFAVSGSFVTNMKIIGAFIWGLTGLYILAALLAERRIEKNVFVKMVSCIMVWIIVYRILTPASASGLIGFWRYQIESASDFWWNDYVLFRGNMYNKETTGMPRAYLPSMIVLTTPIGVEILAAIGAVVVLYRVFRHPKEIFGPTGYAITGIMACLVPVFYAVWNRTPDYNGWRHFYFFYIAIILCVAHGISFLLENKKNTKTVLAVLTGYCLVMAGGILWGHPYEYAFFNCLAGNHVEETYELDYWNMSFKQAYERILVRKEAGEITVGTITNPGYWGLEAQLNALRGKRRMRIILCENWENADYLIVNPTYAFMYAPEDYERISREYILTDQIRSYGNVICEIYQKQQ